jgi:hypothetical protein
VKRWMAVAALGLAIAGGLVTPGTAQASSPAWYQVYQSRSYGSFFQTAAISRNNIWAVGDTYTTAGKTIYRPFIRHFNGRSWQAISIPHASSTADWVSASAADNVWVGGLGLVNRDIAVTVVYRWNGARWIKIPMPRMTFLQGVVALAPNNVWAFGGSGTVADDIFHWNGSRWRYYLSSNSNFIPQGISASGPDNVWASGFAYWGKKQVVVAYRWNGRGWHPVSMPHPVFDNAGPNVTAVSPANVWIGWADNTSSHALHWDGHRWHTVTIPYSADTLNIVPDGQGGYWFGAQAILNGRTWTSEQVPAFTGGYGDVTRIPRTTSFLLSAGVETGTPTPATVKPTVFRFDL